MNYILNFVFYMSFQINRKLNFANMAVTTMLHSHDDLSFLPCSQETLFEFGAIFYGDTSIRFKLSLHTLFPYLNLHHCIMFHILSYDANTPDQAKKPLLEMTSSKTFKQLGINLNRYRTSQNVSLHISAGRLLIVNSSMINIKVIKPLIDCAMREKCISPAGSSPTSHHYDQSAISMILYKNMRHEWTWENRGNSTDQFDKVVAIKRIVGKQVDTDFNLHLCDHDQHHVSDINSFLKRT